MKRQIAKVLGIAAVALPLLFARPVCADPVGGRASRTARVEAHSERVYFVRCNADEITRIRLRGDGDTSLNLYVYDANGNLVDFDVSDPDEILFSPIRTSEFEIHVVNTGDVWNRFTLTAD